MEEYDIPTKESFVSEAVPVVPAEVPVVSEVPVAIEVPSDIEAPVELSVSEAVPVAPVEVLSGEENVEPTEEV